MKIDGNDAVVFGSGRGDRFGRGRRGSGVSGFVFGDDGELVVRTGRNVFEGGGSSVFPDGNFNGIGAVDADVDFIVVDVVDRSPGDGDRGIGRIGGIVGISGIVDGVDARGKRNVLSGDVDGAAEIFASAGKSHAVDIDGGSADDGEDARLLIGVDRDIGIGSVDPDVFIDKNVGTAECDRLVLETGIECDVSAGISVFDSVSQSSFGAVVGGRGNDWVCGIKDGVREIDRRENFLRSDVGRV